MDIVKYTTVPGFPKYQIGDDGNARKQVGDGVFHCLSPIKTSKGYIVFTMISPEGKHDQVRANRVVLLAFIGNPPEGHNEACHRNGLRFDNRLTNLYWGTNAENEQDKEFTNTKLKGERNHQHRLSEDDVRDIKALIKGGTPDKDIAFKYHVSPPTIRYIRIGRNWAWLTI